ncbi:hypothetical protein N9241_02040, partial [bacterium]|nr:hypothetical protein [bacterium]
MFGRSQLSPAIFVCTLALQSTTTEAMDFREKNTGIEGLIDVELAYGLGVRTEDADPELVSIANG